MPIALLILVALYLWLVMRRTRGGEKGTPGGGEIVTIEKLIRFLRLGMMLTSVTIALTMIATSAIAGSQPSERSLFGGTILPIIVNIGTIGCYAFTLVAIGRAYAHGRETRKPVFD